MTTEVPRDSARGSILVVDDDRRIRELIQWALEEEGFVVETAVDGLQGLEAATRTCPALIVLDMHLPVIDGAGVADGLRAAHGDPPPIVLITADDRPVERARRVGAYAYLQKPFDVDELLATVRRGLRLRSG